MSTKGTLLLVLHAHLPFVRNPKRGGTLEEDWLLEALTESYIPLLLGLNRLRRDGVPFALTMSLSPTLCEMLSDPLLQLRYQKRLQCLLDFCEGEAAHFQGQPEGCLAQWYVERLSKIREAYADQFGSDLLAAFGSLQESGHLELMTCAASHALLPLCSEDACSAVQIDLAVQNYRKYFNCSPKGIWLPECAYSNEIQNFLQQAGLTHSVLESHAFKFGDPRPRYGPFAPIKSSGGVSFFARDSQSAREVWSRESGYPGHGAYLEFYRDRGFDAPSDQLEDLLLDGRKRRGIGVKYHRITGQHTPLEHKELYCPNEAEAQAGLHAAQFLSNRIEQNRKLSAQMGQGLCMVAPFDAELFGHWWFEGPVFLETLFREAAKCPHEIELATLSQYLEETGDLQIVEPVASSWGDGGYFNVWLNGQNDWIYRRVHRAEHQMVELAQEHGSAEGMKERALNQAARELILAQSSDWAFMMATGQMVDYAQRRVNGHLSRFEEILTALESQNLDAEALSTWEEEGQLFQELNFRAYDRSAL